MNPLVGPTVKIKLRPVTIDQVDSERGTVPRSEFLRMIIEARYLVADDHCEVAAWDLDSL